MARSSPCQWRCRGLFGYMRIYISVCIHLERDVYAFTHILIPTYVPYINNYIHGEDLTLSMTIPRTSLVIAVSLYLYASTRREMYMHLPIYSYLPTHRRGVTVRDDYGLRQLLRTVISPWGGALFAPTHLRLYIRLYIFVYLHLYASIHTYTHTHARTHTHTYI